MRVRCWLASESITLLASTVDLSETGVRVTAPLHLPVGRVLDISLAIPGSEITAQGRVVWSTASAYSGGAGLGLRFLSPPPPIKDFLATLLPSSHPAR